MSFVLKLGPQTAESSSDFSYKLRQFCFMHNTINNSSKTTLCCHSSVPFPECLLLFLNPLAAPNTVSDFLKFMAFLVFTEHPGLHK